LINALRRVAALPWVGRVLTSRHVEPIVATVLRASPVRRMDAFLAGELRPPAAPAKYRLRGSGAIVFVRHRTPDVAALGEVFYERQYEPPDRVAQMLDALGGPLRIVDLGANVGFFGVFAMERFPSAQMTAVEPDPANLGLLKRTMQANGWSWEVIEAAATNADGEIEFATGRFTTSRIEPGGDLVPSIDALPLLDHADLAKIDIEGGEWVIVGDPRLAALAPAAIVLEYHPYLCPEDDALGYASARLKSSGYDVLPTIEFEAGHGMLWAWRLRQPQRIPVPNSGFEGPGATSNPAPTRARSATPCGSEPGQFSG
jgi:FkbM family methyltransferase